MKFACYRLAAATVLVMLSLLHLLTPLVIQAQALHMAVTIPFEFYVGNEKFPAGDYKIMQQGVPGGSALLILGEHKSNPIVLTTPITNSHPNRNTLVVFNKYAGNLFLSEAHWYGTDIARKLPMSSFELELAKSFTPERVVAAERNR
jgi:hypothetical protein